MQITKQDEQALRAALRRKPRKVHELRALMRAQLRSRLGPQPSGGYFSDECVKWRLAEQSSGRTSVNAVARLLGEWKRQGLVDNPVRGTWQWVGKP